MINARGKGKIIIGDNVLIGPNVVLRSNNHSFKNLNAGVIKFTKKDKPGRGADKQTQITPKLLEAFEAQLNQLLSTLFDVDEDFIEKKV